MKDCHIFKTTIYENGYGEVEYDVVKLSDYNKNMDKLQERIDMLEFMNGTKNDLLESYLDVIKKQGLTICRLASDQNCS